MTFPSGGSVFDEQLQWVKDHFEKWSHCERAIAVCSMLKQFQHPTLRFIHSKIEATYAQSSDCEKIKWMEQNSNDKSYINELCDSYKSLTNTTSDVQLNNNNKDSIYFESDRLIIGDINSTNSISSSTMNNNNNNNYSNNNANSTSIKVNLAEQFSTKEEILKEILNCILMLKIGNDDVIQEYLALIPFMVDDTHRRIINVEVVMQTLSILVAHPALSSENLRTVKEHIERLKCIIQVQNGHFQNTDWQAIAPPLHACHYKTPTTNIFSSLSSVGSSQIQNENLYDTQSDYIETDTGSAGRSSGGGSDFCLSNISIPCKQCHSVNTNVDDAYSFLNASDDQNISFSKNGTEIHDFNPDQEHTNAQFIKNFTLNPLIDNMVLKTRRSNSLTTGGFKQNNQFLGATFTSSTENLSHLHKPRSYSLSIENPRLLMTASGSETRLDDLKPSFHTFQTQNPGMKYVYPWLKRLRLHKYTHIFEKFTFEQMMDVTDSYLEQLTVTQGARTKLVNSIQKLKERYSRLIQCEQDLKNGKVSTEIAIQLLLELVETPMKPVDIYDSTDVAAQFLKLLNTVCNIMNSKQNGPQDEESINQLIQIFDIVQLRNVEPFLSNANQLKDLRYDIDLIKMKFPPKNHYHKNGNGSTNSNANKSRWPSSSKSHSKNGNENKPHRKNSNPMTNFNLVSIQQAQKQQKSQHLGSKSKQTQQRPSRQSEFTNNYHPTPTSSYSKSSSYPNFSSNGSSSASSTGSSQQYANIGNQNTNTPQLHHSYHRHSVSNLITITPAKTTVTVTPTTSISQHQKTSSCMGLHLSSQSTPHSNLSTNSLSNSAATSLISSSIQTAMNYCSRQCLTELTPVTTIGRSSSTGGGSYLKQTSNKNILSDISPYRDLEFLSLQMTEQAIN